MFDVAVRESFRITDGTIVTRVYNQVDNYAFHRRYGPAYTLWYITGNTFCEEWFLNGMRRNKNGPTYSQWHNDDSRTLARQKFYLYGIEITPKNQEWANAMGIPNIMDMTPDELTMFKLTWGK